MHYLYLVDDFFMFKNDSQFFLSLTSLCAIYINKWHLYTVNMAFISSSKNSKIVKYHVSVLQMRYQNPYKGIYNTDYLKAYF